MKKWTVLILCAILMSCAPALADVDLKGYTIYSGTVAAVSFVDVTAPWSGTLRTFDLETGDRVSQGETLFQMLTSEVTAPEDGKLAAVFAEAGDDAAQVLSRYGALAAMESEQAYRILCTTAGAYNDAEHKELHVGELLYWRTTGDGTRQDGTGRVIQVTGNAYVVDILSGKAEDGKRVSLYRADKWEQKDRVGGGDITRRDPVTLSGSGRIGEVLKQAGDSVRKGEVVLSLLGPDADRDASPDIVSPADGVVTAVAVSGGQQVWKGQVLARISRTEELEVIAEVDETDISKIKAGSSMSVTLDMDESDVISAQVTEISALGVTRLNAAYYQVHLRLPAGSYPLGASASLYVP
ncbi:MAG: HlyD family efflux transporter periplasmic adaptor subunit [Clostridia bacterium]|nr:HlyD family efflux transporter periplasmic adaptor subunit [Clostridia bacterium]